MTEKEIVTLNKKQLDFLIHCIAKAMSATERHPLYVSRRVKTYEIESCIKKNLKELSVVE